ncbi:MAG: ABC transporter permease [Hespellia sp.]|nr:ABC transporter permease [Hespellia sp.]
MRNPLNKRLPRELKSEVGKYLVIFVLLVTLIGFVSGFLIADGSMRITYDESFEKYNIEDGYFDLSKEMTENQKTAIETNGVTVYENGYVEEPLENGSTLRIFQNRDEVDRVCLMEGMFPDEEDEIAIDRMYADNNQVEIGDILNSGSRKWKVTGLVALSDYSALFSKNNDTMFDAVKFGVAVVTPKAFDSFSTKEKNYRYSWVYDTKPANETEENDTAENLIKAIGKVVTLEAFVPQYQNQAIHFTGEDMGSDRSMMIALLYIVIVILAFVFGITISNTITKEANTIGTLRASGYTRGELVKHYMVLPMVVTAAGAVIGNGIGYTVMEDVCKNMYYGSYSLTKYKTTVNAEAFLITTVSPFFIMLLINLAILSSKLTLSPLQFLRRDLRRRKQKRTIRLGNKIPFFSRFRLRIIFQNRSNYLMLFIGILFANLLLLFGMGLPIVLDHYQENIQQNLISPYQYMLRVPTSILSEESKVKSLLSMMEFSRAVETDNETAEAFSAYSLNTTSEICDSEEILLYGIQDNSRYVSIDFSKIEGDKGGNGVYISSAYADKYQLRPGDSITLKEKYKGDTYKFCVEGIYDYIGALAMFMPKAQLGQIFDMGNDYFSGYFSETEITDINSKYIGSVIDSDALTKVSRQLDVSMGSVMYLVDGFAMLIFIVLIYLLSKLVIEKNAQSISMTKILGYRNGEISRLYILATSVMVVLSMVVTIVIDYYLMLWIFRQIMLRSMSGWIQFEVDSSLFIKMFVTGILTYAIVAVMEFRKIQKVPMNEALKNAE